MLKKFLTQENCQKIAIAIFLFIPCTANADEAAKGSMPQMDVSTFESQLFWLAVIFTVLYFGFSKIFLPKVDSILQKRKEHIQTDTDLAKKIALDAQKIDAIIEKEQKEILQKARNILQKAQSESSTFYAQKSDALLKDAQEKFSQIEQEIREQKKKYFLNAEGVAVELCEIIIEKVSGSKLNQEEIIKEMTTHKKEQELRIAC